MPTLTQVLPQKKNPHRFNIYLDGQFAFGADEDLVVEYRLIPGKALDQSILEKLLFEAEVGKLMERIYRLFNIRQRSEREVRDYLKNLSFKRKVKGQEAISEVVINLLVEKLKQKRLINDTEFAKAWLDARSKKRGLISIKGELFKKGISREIIDEITEIEGLESKQENTARQLLMKRLPRFKNLPLMERKKKSFEFLMRRGFDYEIVKTVVEKLAKLEYTKY